MSPEALPLMPLAVGNRRAGDEVVITSRTILGARAVAASLQAEVGSGVRVQARHRPFCRMGIMLSHLSTVFGT